MNFNWLYLILAAGVVNVFYDLITRYSLKDKTTELEYAWAFGLVRTVFFSILLFFDYKFSPSLRNTLLLLLIGTLNTANIYLLMKMHSANELSISTTIIKLQTVFIPILSFIFLSEKLLMKEYIGILILFLGVTIVMSPKKIIYDKAARIALFFSIGASITTVLMKGVSSEASTPMIGLFMSFPILFIIPLFTKRKIEFIKKVKDEFGKKSAIAILGATTLYLFISALSFGEVAKISAIFQGTAVLSVVSGILLLKERERMLAKVAGILIATAGALILI